MNLPSLRQAMPLAGSPMVVSSSKASSVGQPQFGKHVVPALRNLLAAADEANLNAIGALAEDLLAKKEL